ncbi:hypothetical protein [Nocardioides sp. zg-DK7169]|uniref:hypothetical protein n=1 Tax=Nocardioides sp. zg-DK7169 TaxID=2736600 RepID=UPI001555C7A9|nr:hypothetical protein [Nocardioides sp. zg-DK7169]NPC98737.1 hypothetical protein [Nocardioides sp. zg-DK7169]
MPAIRAAVGSLMPRVDAEALIASGDLDPGRCQIVWNVRDRAVIHPVSQMQVPSLEAVKSVRRIGTYKGAQSRIAMYPVIREGKATMLELESQLERFHALKLSLDPRVSDLLAQPFLMLWRHPRGSVLHVPDLAARRGQEWTVYAVKPDERSSEERVRLMFDFAAEALRCARVGFEVRGSLSKQQRVNLDRLARYRVYDAGLEALVEVAALRRPRTMGGFYGVIRGHLGFGQTLDLPSVGCPSLVGLDAALYALAHGHVGTPDLDQPIRLATPLLWAADQER